MYQFWEKERLKEYLPLGHNQMWGAIPTLIFLEKMDKKKIYFLAIGLICSVAILTLLYYNFSTNKVSQEYLKQGGFNRKLLAINSTPKKSFDLEKGYYNIVGFSKDTLTIRKMNDRNLIVFYPDQTKSSLELPKIINPENVFSISFNPNNSQLIDIQCNNDRKIFVFDLKSRQVTNTYQFNTFFDKAVRTSDSSFTAFISEKDTKESMLTTIEFDREGKELNAQKSNISKVPMTDDGMLRRYGKGLIYVNYYNNNISIIDSTLSREMHFRTIDTVTTKPKTVTIRNNTITKFVNAPRPVNQLVEISNGYMFINSYVRADNDSENDPNNENDLIDVYDLKNNCKYIGTIYTLKYENQSIQDFLIEDKRLVLQYPNKTVIYDFSM